MLVWMNQKPLEPGRPYLIKHTTQQAGATVLTVRHRVNINTLEDELVERLGFNEIGAVMVEAKRPIFFDPYDKNRATGAFILIDTLTNETLAAGMITGRAGETAHTQRSMAPELSTGRVTPVERYSRAGHRPVAIWLPGDEELAVALERKLFDRGCIVHVLTGESVVEIAQAASDAGLISICALAEDDVAIRGAVARAVGGDRFLPLNYQDLPSTSNEAVDAVCRILEDHAFIPRLPKPFTGGAGI
jgi:hypothetical protein